jgi:XTP/dITP diphosphohydrolase
MSLLVVPLAPEETGALTLREWELLKERSHVFFEDPSHPLVARLNAEGVNAGPFDDEPDPQHPEWALVVDPRSPRLIELARAGATIVIGSLDTPDALTAAHGAKIARRAAVSLERFVAIMARLRSVDGCPWDREQTHKSLAVHLIEEAHEVLEAIDRGTVKEELEEELGDLLLQVAFHAQLALDDERFDIAGVADAISGKLVHRHPHVFGDVSVSGAADVVRNWEAIKAAEKQRDDAFADIPSGLPALLAAYKTQKRAAGLGFETDDPAARAVRLLDQDATEETVGEALFWVVAAARAEGIDPEGALRSATLRFRAGYG